MKAPPAAAPPSLSPVLAELSVEVPLERSAAYAIFVDEIESWWDHHLVDKPAALVLNDHPGGSFVEFFDSLGNGAEHARVIFAKRGEAIRFSGPMGFSGQAVELVQSLRFEPTGRADTTRVSVHVELIGTLDGAMREAVKGAWQHFLSAYRAYAEQRASAKHDAAGGSAANYEQAPRSEAQEFGFFSHADRAAKRNHIHADDFRLARAAPVVRVAWWGHSDRAGAQGFENVSDFTVRIHALAVSGGPGAVIFEQSFPVRAVRGEAWTFSAAPTPSKPAPNQQPSIAPAGPIWRYEVTLAEPVKLSSDAPFFLSIAAHRATPDGANWQWSDAQQHNGTSFSHPFDVPAWQTIQDTDSAFLLYLGPDPT